MYTSQMEWKIGNKAFNSNWWIETKLKEIWPSDYCKNGKLKKNAKPSHCPIGLAGFREFAEQVVLEHNLWVNRENPERLREIIKHEIEAKTMRSLRSIGKINSR